MVLKQKQWRMFADAFSPPSSIQLPLETAAFQFLLYTFIPCFRGNAVAQYVSHFDLYLCAHWDANHQPHDASSLHTHRILLYLFSSAAFLFLLTRGIYMTGGNSSYIRISSWSRMQPLFPHQFTDQPTFFTNNYGKTSKSDFIDLKQLWVLAPSSESSWLFASVFIQAWGICGSWH